jgi:hypothetical protein
VSVPARRAGVAFAMGKGLSQRRACTLLGAGRSALHYCSTKLSKDTPVLARMAELAAQYPRYGYWRIEWVMLSYLTSWERWLCTLVPDLSRIEGFIKKVSLALFAGQAVLCLGAVSTSCFTATDHILPTR